jgi:nucleoside-diphosphate-sugar epimerase
MVCGDGSHSMGFVNLDDVMDTNVLAAESDI